MAGWKFGWLRRRARPKFSRAENAAVSLRQVSICTQHHFWPKLASCGCTQPKPSLQPSLQPNAA